MVSVLLWIVILCGIIFLLNKFFSRHQNQGPNQNPRDSYHESQNQSHGRVFEHESAEDEPMQTASASNNDTGSSALSTADSKALLESAKALFLDLQEAWNHEKLSVLQKHTSAKVFTRVQSSGRDGAISVVTLQAELERAHQSGDQLQATVRFSGQLRAGQKAPFDFNEQWQLSRAADGVLKVDEINED